ncbi:MAG: formylglycine-generating enzyme family protein [Merismopedia sp. SIO2A8]|nr:formylglycine-generating enzyme family protein [Merismopedia sp. SIO2A8]
MSTAPIQTKTCTNKRFFEELGGEQRLEMLLISGSTFEMGSPPTEEGREFSEGPQHPVTVPTFFLGRYPVTQSQWEQVSQFKPVNSDVVLRENPSRFSGRDDSRNRPVERVTWYESVEFCDRLSANTGRNYRLPSESEWEYACRGGTTTPFYCGETITTEIANYDGRRSYGRGPEGEYIRETTPIDHFKMANPFCLSDMHGNVWEWCLDHWHDSYNGAPANGSAWTTGGRSYRRVVRGGSWYYDSRDCRSASRSHSLPDTRDYTLGFRVVLAPRSASPSR